MAKILVTYHGGEMPVDLEAIKRQPALLGGLSDRWQGLAH